MPGNPLDLLYPATGDSTTAVQVKWSTNFEIIQADLEHKVTEADIRVNGPLVMYDHPLTEVGSLLMSEQSAESTVEGTLTYANGFWYVADAVGAVRLTDGAGGFNSAGFKGIGGDYGAGDPAEMTYDAAAGAYSLTDDPGVYSDLKLEKLLLQRAAGSLSISADAAISGAQAMTIQAPPVSGTAALTVSSAGVVAPGATITVAQTFADLTATVLRRPAATKAIPLALVQWVTDATVTFTRAGGQIGVVPTGVTSPVLTIPLDVEVGQQLNSVTIYTSRTGAGTVSLTIYSVTSLGVKTAISTAATSVATGNVTLTASVTTPGAMGAGVWYEAELTYPLSSTNSLTGAFFNKQG